MSTTQLVFEPPYTFIKERLTKGKVIPFLGSGASIPSKVPEIPWTSPQCGFLPKAGELAKYLERLSGFPAGEETELARVAQYFDGITGRGGLDDELHGIFARSYEPLALHHYLAELDTNILGFFADCAAKKWPFGQT